MRHRWDTLNPPTIRWGIGNSDATLRVSDAERNEVADKLSRHFAEGRLDQTEFKERLDTAMSAKTQGDLAGLFDDLPRLGTEPLPPPSRRRRLIPFVVMIALVALAAGTTFSFLGGFHVPWILIVIAGIFLWTRLGRRHHHHQHDSSEA